jgi:hypothetical protein
MRQDAINLSAVEGKRLQESYHPKDAPENRGSSPRSGRVARPASHVFPPTLGRIGREMAVTREALGNSGKQTASAKSNSGIHGSRLLPQKVIQEFTEADCFRKK